jgi:hypothetical protein
MERIATSWGFIKKRGYTWAGCKAAAWTAGDGWVGIWSDSPNYWNIGRMWAIFNTDLTEEEWNSPAYGYTPMSLVPVIDGWQASYSTFATFYLYSDETPTTGKSMTDASLSQCGAVRVNSGEQMAMNCSPILVGFNSNGATSTFLCTQLENSYSLPVGPLAIRLDSATPRLVSNFSELNTGHQLYRIKIGGGAAEAGPNKESGFKTKNKYGSG